MHISSSIILKNIFFQLESGLKLLAMLKKKKTKILRIKAPNMQKKITTPNTKSPYINYTLFSINNISKTDYSVLR